MEVRIGIKHSPRELSFETESTAEEVRGQIESAIGQDSALLALSDTKGRQYLVDTESIAYIELGGESGRKVGFIS
ncbi:DUF3107 domain-containing protein [Leucobacter allii]|uniref:DUF3107 domain-containing protein n=1 Tax=Leucobacter allii TaxID=2932247 RepID=A0ABY4FHE4_9MICO|nr:DUF3107 domain-containing protein [Leucobacter allii]UOQ55820.1 DUF3107 domain-containing protein [Leucobacter allii]UOR00332.1 DUF3107 domain-containing protein [Leucobacter allii]